MVIVIDTREQRPLDFTFWKDVTVQRRECWPGDYTLLGHSDLLSVERKSVADLIGTMKTGYTPYGATSPKRFSRELMALSKIRQDGGNAFVLVEPDGPSGTVRPAFEQIMDHSYRSAIEPHKVLAFIDTIRAVWGVPVILTDSRTRSAEIIREACLYAHKIREARLAERKFMDRHEFTPPDPELGF